jgi:hypothetical protein
MGPGVSSDARGRVASRRFAPVRRRRFGSSESVVRLALVECARNTGAKRRRAGQALRQLPHQLLRLQPPVAALIARAAPLHGRAVIAR